MSDLTLFKDKGLTQPFVIEDIGTVEAGDIRTLDGYLYNSTINEIVNIDYEVEDKDVRIFNIPDSMMGETWSKVEITYSPDKLRTTALNTFVTFRGKKKIPPE